MFVNTNRFRFAVSFSLILLVLLIDQVVKFYVKTHMLLYEKIEITNWFYICFIENRGMAFGMDFIGTFFLAIFRIAAIGCFIWIMRRVIRSNYPMGMIICCSLILAGAIGNIIDNCFYGLIFEESHNVGWYCDGPAQLVALGNGYGDFLSGKVVDMFYFPLFTWPDWVPFFGGDVFFNAIFNVADISISCGAISLLLFYHRYLAKDLFKKSAL